MANLYGYKDAAERDRKELIVSLQSRESWIKKLLEKIQKHDNSNILYPDLGNILIITNVFES